jgi:hypothetical protein
MEPTTPTTTIQRLEMMAHAVQSGIAYLDKGSLRDKMVMRLAALDRIIATRKDHSDVACSPDCSYLEA